MHDPCFIPFSTSVANISLPEKFTFPFYYQPHPLSQLAAEQLQDILTTPQQWQHNFGLNAQFELATCKESIVVQPQVAHSPQTINKNLDMVIGKMFGVLVVKNRQGELGFLAAFSGKLADQNVLTPFVPPVFDMLTKDSFFADENEQINQINTQLTKLESNPQYLDLCQQQNDLEQDELTSIADFRQAMVSAKAQRKQQRTQIENQLELQQITLDSFNQTSIELSRQSVQLKQQLASLKQSFTAAKLEIDKQLESYITKIATLKQQRKTLSNELQQKLFAQYAFLNAKGETQDLNTLFNDAPNQQPPAGAGECAAPKLLQYAYLHQYQPIALAEFWWGASPKSEVKQHKQYYPACHGKCRPILGHMLDGLSVDDDPLLINKAKNVELAIIYQDEHLAIVNKPPELLSVTGKNITDSVQSRMKTLYPHATGPLIVHRLDMSTSGLMVIALTKEANKHLQQQFINRTVKKRYVALVEGVLAQNSGEINLPLRVDLDDRPKQLVCYQYGKPAYTLWYRYKVKGNQTLVHLYPQTGRTHQLRMHCAHQMGLNMAIVGDDLYGTPANRLHLHADFIEFNHPFTNDRVSFSAIAEFE